MAEEPATLEGVQNTLSRDHLLRLLSFSGRVTDCEFPLHHPTSSEIVLAFLCLRKAFLRENNQSSIRRASQASSRECNTSESYPRSFPDSTGDEYSADQALIQDTSNASTTPPTNPLASNSFEGFAALSRPSRFDDISLSFPIPEEGSEVPSLLFESGDDLDTPIMSARLGPSSNRSSRSLLSEALNAAFERSH
ncbi:hypothetical protein J8273_0597 [Carpediemonas membranifera]|uniref:Uncharacterized protein n=1 Tax=Carpediemonas membranifera TaxID=201153 RepID=A0A8J6AZS3_9EUKA|nr:hypothetical protein J8273_0597 [Carpediemonas membranifera]|eukprot:KAG9395355.1 hypothetical protein J8273_0597 [Carpediemonas membranifera]